MSREIVFGHGISAVRIASLSPHPHPTSEIISPITFWRVVLSILTIIVPYVFWWRMCLNCGITELCMVLFSFQVSDLLTAFRLPVWSNVDRVVLLRDFDNGAEREPWGRQRHRRTLSGVSASVIMYVAFISKCGSVKNLGTSVRKKKAILVDFKEITQLEACLLRLNSIRCLQI